MRRSVVFSLALLVASFFVTSCDTAPETVLSPDSESAAKGGIPGAPDSPDDGADGGDDGSAAASNLVEYYVIPSPDGVAPNVVHVVVDGSAAQLGAQLVHDYFFNGIRDDDYSPHYEWYDNAAFDPATERVEVLDNGHTHIDVEWSGQWWLTVGDPDRDTIAHSDFLSTEVATATGGAADPFAFAPSVYDASRNFIAGWQPQGVILDGAVVGKDGITISEGWHAGSSVTSYALHGGASAAVQVSLLSMAASNVTCSTETVREGIGRNKTTTTYTTLSATAAVQFQMSDGQRHGYWAEFHLRPVDGEVSVPAPGSSINGGTSSDGIGLDSPREFTVSTRFEGEYSSVDVELVMDYLVYTGVRSETDPSGTYDPAANSNDGFVTNTGPSTTVDNGSWPEAVRQLGTVTCR